MQVTNRQFYNTAELKEMIKGFEMLFGIKPVVRIEVHGPNGLPSGTRIAGSNPDAGELLFFPSSGFELHKIGRTLIAVITGPDIADLVQIDATDNQITFHAAFYLP